MSGLAVDQWLCTAGTPTLLHTFLNFQGHFDCAVPQFDSGAEVLKDDSPGLSMVATSERTNPEIASESLGVLMDQLIWSSLWKSCTNHPFLQVILWPTSGHASPRDTDLTAHCAHDQCRRFSNSQSWSPSKMNLCLGGPFLDSYRPHRSMLIFVSCLWLLRFPCIPWCTAMVDPKWCRRGGHWLLLL